MNAHHQAYRGSLAPEERQYFCWMDVGHVLDERRSRAFTALVCAVSSKWIEMPKAGSNSDMETSVLLANAPTSANLKWNNNIL
ncbi:MAG TPA: hypothetical protein VM912_00215 [Terriglobales bacterium]|nr:hypothetical protein [Terriglobales bacterium]